MDDINSALFTACRYDHVEIVELLLSHGAKDTTAVDLDRTALYATCLYGYDQCLSLLLKHAVDLEATCHGAGSLAVLACTFSHLKCLAMLVEYGIDINRCCSFTGQTCLTYSCKDSKIVLIRYLLNHGADANTMDMYRMTPSQTAYAAGYDECIALLIQHGADESIMKIPPPQTFLKEVSSL